MTRNTKRRWGISNERRSTSRAVFVQFASQRRIAPSTARDWYHGRVGTPLWHLEQMAAVAGRLGRLDVVERFIQRIRGAAESSRELTPELIAETQMADVHEDSLEERFRLNPSAETWAPLRKAKLHAVALERELIAAADERYAT